MPLISIPEHDARITWMKKRIGIHGPDIQDRVQDAMTEFGICKDTGYDYYHKAMAQLKERAEKSVDKHRYDAVVVYDSIINDPQTSRRDRIQAQRAKDQLLGTQAPRQIQVQGTIQSQVNLEHQRIILSDPELVKAAALLEKATANADNHHTSGPSTSNLSG